MHRHQFFSLAVGPRVSARSRSFIALSLTCLWLVVYSGIATAQSPPKPLPPVGISVDEGDGTRRISAVLSGNAIDIAPWPGGGLAVLTAQGTEDGPRQGPRSLYRLQGNPGDIRPVIKDLDPEVTSVALREPALDAGAPGTELWIGRPGLIQALDAGVLRTVVERPGIDLQSISPQGIVDHEIIPLHTLGNLVFLRGHDLEPLGQTRLPLTARRTVHGLELSSLPVRPLSDAEGLAKGLAAGPEANGSTRLRTYLLDLKPNEAPAGDAVDVDVTVDAESTPVQEAYDNEAWSRLPAAESVEQSWYRTIDGRPALIVTTTRSDKLGLFDKLQLRVFLLGADRTRAGRAPLFRLDTVTRRWFKIVVDVRDLDADGKDDLILVQPEGLGAGKLFVDVYPGSTSGSFASKPRRTKLDLEDARWHYGSDLIGDAIPDLVLLRRGGLEVYAGLADHRKLSVERQASLTAQVGGTDRDVVIEVSVGSESTSGPPQSLDNTLQAVDIDADGRSELIAVTNLEPEAAQDASDSQVQGEKTENENRVAIKIIEILVP